MIGAIAAGGMFAVILAVMAFAFWKWGKVSEERKQAERSAEIVHDQAQIAVNRDADVVGRLRDGKF